MKLSKYREFLVIIFILILGILFIYFFSKKFFILDKKSFNEKENIFPKVTTTDIINIFPKESNKELLEKSYKNYLLNKNLDEETVSCLGKVSVLNPNPDAFISAKNERNNFYGDYEYKGLLTDLVEFNFENCQFVALRLIRGDYLFSIYIPSKMPTATGRIVNYPKDLSKFINKEITVYVRYALTEDKNSKLILGWDLRE